MFSLIIFLITFGILILVHEFGHFMQARRVGVRVERFSMGFGPVLFKKKRNSTEYALSLIPLGGYVKLAGDNLEEYKGGADEYFSKTPLQRAKIIFWVPALNYILGFFCFWLIFFAGYPTLTTKVGALLEGYGAKDAGVQVGDRILAIDGKRLASWDELQIAIYTHNLPAVVKLSVLRADKTLEIAAH